MGQVVLDWILVDKNQERRYSTSLKEGNIRQVSGLSKVIPGRVYRERGSSFKGESRKVTFSSHQEADRETTRLDQGETVLRRGNLRNRVVDQLLTRFHWKHSLDCITFHVSHQKQFSFQLLIIQNSKLVPTKRTLIYPRFKKNHQEYYHLFLAHQLPSVQSAHHSQNSFGQMNFAPGTNGQVVNGRFIPNQSSASSHERSDSAQPSQNAQSGMTSSGGSGPPDGGDDDDGNPKNRGNDHRGHGNGHGSGASSQNSNTGNTPVHPGGNTTVQSGGSNTSLLYRTQFREPKAPIPKYTDDVHYDTWVDLMKKYFNLWHVPDDWKVRMAWQGLPQDKQQLASQEYEGDEDVTLCSDVTEVFRRAP